MKKFILLCLLSIALFACSIEDNLTVSSVPGCNCYFDVYENAQLQPEDFRIPSDITDCSQDGSIKYFPGQEGDEYYYMKLHCNQE